MRRYRSLLPWIIAFKAFKSVTLIVLGITLLNLRHSDPIDRFVQVVLALHLPLTSRMVERILAFLANLTVRKETALALSAFAYAILMAVEGLALHFRHPWARWFTIIATSSLIPFEVYEIVRAPGPARVLVLLANIAIVIYLWKREDVFDTGPYRT